MKLKKSSYLLVFILMLLIGITPAYARRKPASSNIKGETCYYKSADNNGMAYINSKTHTVIVNRTSSIKLDNDDEPLLNSRHRIWPFVVTDVTDTSVNLEWYHINQCPKVLIIRTTKKYDSYGVWGTDQEGKAQKAVDESNATGKYYAYYAAKTTKEEYYNSLVGDSDEVPFEEVEINCNTLLGSVNDDGQNGKPMSVRYMTNTALNYVKIIVPILIIVLGIIDLGKAVLASKEDEMRKAQSTFVKRVLIGVLVFFVPLIVGLVMDMAEIVWDGQGYSVCTLVETNEPSEQ